MVFGHGNESGISRRKTEGSSEAPVGPLLLELVVQLVVGLLEQVVQLVVGLLELVD